MNVLILLLWGWMVGQETDRSVKDTPVATIYRGPGIVDPFSTYGHWESRGISDGKTVLESNGHWELNR